ncbi:hypothetical protein E5161_08755 [Cohnella pontilimi]|uniref:Carbohydrate diacid regulator n=1 Tax=Cohnella pontilimi TaxID=2564100 RepID=A0A4U0FDB6_9BACL|nr:sugar diacid recognition domain-containing protein [Cohnella pontilimi]TJY42913.1 hypothetical protein E5161_08755 [Cohnella pontilimi]
MVLLTKELAQELVNETMKCVDRNINIMDAQGIVIGSGDPSRIGHFHEAAYEAITSKQMLIVNEKNASRWRGAQAGVNLPILDGSIVIGAIGITGLSEDVKPLGQLVKMTAELLIRQKKLRLQEEWRQRTVDGIVKELVESDLPDAIWIEHRLSDLQLNLACPFRVLLLFSPDKTVSEEILYPFACSTFKPEEALVSIMKPHGVVVLIGGVDKTGITRRLELLQEKLNRLKEDVQLVAACSGQVLHFREARVAFREAILANRLSSVHPNPIVYFEEIEAEALTHVIPTEHLERILGKVKPVWNTKMQETLSCLFACHLNMAEAVRQLGIHRNTMLYRLERIKEITGYDPLHFQDAMILQWVVWSLG